MRNVENLRSGFYTTIRTNTKVDMQQCFINNLKNICIYIQIVVHVDFSVLLQSLKLLYYEVKNYRSINDLLLCFIACCLSCKIVVNR